MCVMPGPLNLVVGRHCKSEGNVATATELGGQSLAAYTEAFRSRPPWQWRLVQKGQMQAKAMGRWLRTESGLELPFHRHATSSYFRGRETAALLELPEAEWFLEPDLREQDRNDLGTVPILDDVAANPREFERFATDPLHSTPPLGGEGLMQMRPRIRSVLDTLYRECSQGNVILITHKQFILALMMLLQRIPPEEFLKQLSSDDPHFKVHNGQILHWTRVNPADPQDIRPYYMWVRSICPWDQSRSSNEWRAIERRRFSNAALLESIEIAPLLIP